MTLETEFARVLGREATADELAELLRLKEALNLADNDALWVVLIALQYHKTLYDQVPGKIERAVASAKADMEALAQAEITKAQAELSIAVVAEAKKLATRLDMSRFLLAGMASLVLFFVFGAICFLGGFGLAQGNLTLPAILKIPSGFAICGLFLVGGILVIIEASFRLSEAKSSWKKRLLLGLGLILIAAVIFASTF